MPPQPRIKASRFMGGHYSVKSLEVSRGTVAEKAEINFRIFSQIFLAKVQDCRSHK